MLHRGFGKPQAHVHPVVRLILLIDGGEVKEVRLAPVELAGPFELSHERGELVLPAAVVQQLDLADELRRSASRPVTAVAGGVDRSVAAPLF